jgi:lipopolysaccharide export system protein LptA
MWLGLVLFSLMVTSGMAGNDLPARKTADPEAKKIHITADRLISNTKENHAEFMGNVFRQIRTRKRLAGPIPGEAGCRRERGN